MLMTDDEQRTRQTTTGQSVPVKVRAERAPKKITTAKQALHAFHRMQQYRDAADMANTRASWAGSNSHTQEKHERRHAALCDVVDEWATVLRDYLQRQADQSK